MYMTLNPLYVYSLITYLLRSYNFYNTQNGAAESSNPIPNLNVVAEDRSVVGELLQDVVAKVVVGLRVVYPRKECIGNPSFLWG